ncbi:hypothetical protein [Agromyces mangrovi Wang et al. 2018]|uniref:hypothetical protein n=1 Tax=Agromyces mangrovi TaxID=1858653 RepID=UPI0025725C23|nr:hypothetical protein [Agromyces mangrovi]BDZ64858.1 hypothetical protein GCM10025877_17960 [Agromyces mangrovi]
MPLLLALPVGAAGGVVLALGLYLASNPDFRLLGGWGAFGSLVGAGALLGGMTALAAMIGALIAVLVVRGSRAIRGRVLTGAAFGAAAMWLGIAAVNAFVTPGGELWFPLAIMIAGGAALVAVALAALLLAVAPMPGRSRAAAPSGLPGSSG